MQRSWNVLLRECREVQKNVLETAARLNTLSKDDNTSQEELDEVEKELDSLLELEERLIHDLEKWIAAYDDFGGTTETVQQVIDDTKYAMKRRLRQLLDRTAHLHLN
jgi:sugar-specific transcriptional regulator TrmB